VSLPALLRLRLNDFRCFPRLDWHPPGGRLLLVGPNGTGKTRLLEAVYLAATTESFRTPRARRAEAFAGFQRLLVTSSREEVWRGVGGLAEVALAGPGAGP
jgi:recombinational DNA repair ATPase RecF